MIGLNAETYIRRCAEDELSGPTGDDNGAERLRESARALVTVGLLDRDVARGILSGHARACMLRGLPSHPFHDQHDGAADTEPRRVCAVSGEVHLSDGTLLPRVAVLSTDRTRLAVALQRAGRKGQHKGQRKRMRQAATSTLTVRDDAGRSVHAHFSGGGGEDEWRGWFTASPGLSRDTKWIEIAGTRLPLNDADTGATVTIEDLVEDDATVEERATRYLEHWLEAAGGDYDDTPIKYVADALIRCGALPAETPIAQAARETDGRRATAYARAATVSHRGGARAGSPVRADSLVVGVSTPPFSGLAITVITLNLTPHGFTVEIEGSGHINLGHHRGGIDTPRLTFAASDDLGNSYRGHIEEFGHGEGGFGGTIRFEGPPAEQAGAVDVRFGTATARAVVHIPLPAEVGA